MRMIGAGQLVQWLRLHSAFIEDLGSTQYLHGDPQLPVTKLPGYLMLSSSLLSAPAHMWCTQTYTKTDIHTK